MKQRAKDMAFGALLALAVFQYVHHVILDVVRAEADRAIAAADQRCGKDHHH